MRECLAVLRGFVLRRFHCERLITEARIREDRAGRSARLREVGFWTIPDSPLKTDCPNGEVHEPLDTFQTLLLCESGAGLLRVEGARGDLGLCCLPLSYLYRFQRLLSRQPGGLGAGRVDGTAVTRVKYGTHDLLTRRSHSDGRTAEEGPKRC